MLGTLVALGPVLAGLAAGFALRRSGAAAATHGRFLLFLNLYLCMPALVLRSLAEVALTPRLAVFPLAALVMVASGYLVGRVASRGAQDAAVVVMAMMVVNCAFALPFVEAVHGAAGVARLVAFDLVNNLLVLTVVHAMAAAASPARDGRRAPVAQVLRTPPLYAALAGLGLSVTGSSLPAAVDAVLVPFAGASPLLIAVGTGILFTPTGAMLRRAGPLAATRVAVGLAVASLLVVALDLEGVDRDVLLLLGVAPVGFVIVTFASQHRLDTDLATEALALSMALSLVASLVLSVVLVTV